MYIKKLYRKDGEVLENVDVWESSEFKDYFWVENESGQTWLTRKDRFILLVPDEEKERIREEALRKINPFDALLEKFPLPSPLPCEEIDPVGDMFRAISNKLKKIFKRIKMACHFKNRRK